MKFLVFAGSLKQTSLNHKLAELVAQRLVAANMKVDLARFSEFDAPSYSEDVQNTTGFPAPIELWKQRILAADGLVIVSPEYNFSIPGGLKNGIDWLSRYRPTPVARKPILLLSASPGLVGGNRALWALRVPLESMGSHVHPNMFSLASASDAFSPHGDLKNEALAQKLTENVMAFVDYTSRLSSSATPSPM